MNSEQQKIQEHIDRASYLIERANESIGAAIEILRRLKEEIEHGQEKSQRRCGNGTPRIY